MRVGWPAKLINPPQYLGALQSERLALWAVILLKNLFHEVVLIELLQRAQQALAFGMKR
jgi:hypothetical protein